MATKRKDGRYQSSVTVTNPFTGKKTRKYVYAYTLEELNKEKKRLVLELEDIFTNSTNIKLSTYADEIIKRKKDEGLSPVSIYIYENDIKKYIKPLLGHLPLNKITPLIIRSALLSNVKSTQTVKKRILNLLKMILNQAYYDELITKNPCEHIIIKNEPVKEKDIINDEEYSKLLNLTIGTYIHELYILAYETGMRRAELAALSWEQIPFLFDDNLIPAIYVDRAMKCVYKQKIIGKTKTNSGKRIVLLSDIAIDALKQQLQRQKEFAIRKDIPFHQTDYVFTNNMYKPISVNTITFNFTLHKHQAKIKETLSFHSFRHTHATILMQSGLSEKAISERLGHKSFIFTLNRYTHSTEEAQKQIVDFLNKKTIKNDVRNDVKRR